jgi:hypothetical protein
LTIKLTRHVVPAPLVVSGNFVLCG